MTFSNRTELWIEPNGVLGAIVTLIYPDGSTDFLEGCAWRYYSSRQSSRIIEDAYNMAQFGGWIE